MIEFNSKSLEVLLKILDRIEDYINRGDNEQIECLNTLFETMQGIADDYYDFFQTFEMSLQQAKSKEDLVIACRNFQRDRTEMARLRREILGKCDGFLQNETLAPLYGFFKKVTLMLAPDTQAPAGGVRMSLSLSHSRTLQSMLQTFEETGEIDKHKLINTLEQTLSILDTRWVAVCQAYGATFSQIKYNRPGRLFQKRRKQISLPKTGTSA